MDLMRMMSQTEGRPRSEAAMFSPEIQHWPWLVACLRASKRDVRSSTQRIPWNPLNGTPVFILDRIKTGDQSKVTHWCVYSQHGWNDLLIPWRSDVTLWGSWTTPHTGRAAAMFSPRFNFDPGWQLSTRASKLDVRSSAQRIQWNPLNGTPREPI